MTRLASLVVFASIFAYVLAQETTTEPNENGTTTDMSTTTDMTPEVPTQGPQAPGNWSFASDNKVCIRLVATMTLDITYLNTNGGFNSSSIDLDNITSLFEQNSTCGDNNQAIGLFFTLFDDEADPQFITFKFHKGDKDEWSVSDVLYSFLPTSLPPDFDQPGNIPNTTMITLPATEGLMDTSNTNIDVKYSYKCSNKRDLLFNSTVVEKRVNATLSITDLQIQAFIESNTNGQFGNVRDCNASKGNKIVPIAVGAALAGLVIVVLIAYLIGRLKSRRQSSYEALS